MASAAPAPSSHPTAYTLLTDWGKGMDRALARGEPGDAAWMAQIVLRHRPRHLPTYYRLLTIAWTTKRWDEGEDWARRLLQADPGYAPAWQALAMAAEQRGHRAQAQAMWQRAFEMSPYGPEIRAGLARTSLDAPNALALNAACLAMLYVRGRRWTPAVQVYRQLVKADPRRIDFQQALMLAWWQQHSHDEAYVLARHLVQSQPHLVLAWAVLAAIGDQNDRALAYNPLMSMDPDGEYVTTIFGVHLRPLEPEPFTIDVDADEAAWLTAYLDNVTV